MLPARFNDLAELRQVEPYVVCQSTHSRFSPRFGAGRVSWLSGSAVWNYVAMTQAILGIQPDYTGLRINPCLPRHWSGYKAQRHFRGHRVHIEVKNPQGICHGVKSLAVNDQTIEGNLIPADLLQDSLHVTATLAL